MTDTYHVFDSAGWTLGVVQRMASGFWCATSYRGIGGSYGPFNDRTGAESFVRTGPMPPNVAVASSR